MDNKLLKRTLSVWVLFVPMAFVNGAIRNFVYRPFTDELAAHQISTVTASAAVVILAYCFLRKDFAKKGMRTLLMAGVIWVAMTALFEFGFGHYIAGNSWEKLFADYDLTKGRVWGLFLVLTLFAPAIVKRLAAYGK